MVSPALASVVGILEIRPEVQDPTNLQPRPAMNSQPFLDPPDDPFPQDRLPSRLAPAAGDAKRPRILLVTPEVAYVPETMTADARRVHAKAGGLADISALLLDGLRKRGLDIFLAIPHYRTLFRDSGDPQSVRVNPGPRIFLTDDCRFYRRHEVYQGTHGEQTTTALAFQRDVITRIIPAVKPDIVHCNDWMTGLIPAAAAKMGIPSLFTLHNTHSEQTTLAELDNRGIPGADFWDLLYFDHFPQSHEESFWSNPVDLLASGILAATHVNTVSPSFLAELIQQRHDCLSAPISQLLAMKQESGRASGILNAPDSSFDPELDPHLTLRYGATSHIAGKAANKQEIQRRLGLDEAPGAPLFFWPSRLDPIQKGCQLLAEILGKITCEDFVESGIQFIFIADGPHQVVFQEIVAIHQLHRRVAVVPFDEALSHLAYGGADFVLMPSSYEPCGLPQMIGARYGTLPVAHRTGGIRDTMAHLDTAEHRGNGFLFNDFDTNALRWGIGEAIGFHRLPSDIQKQERRRIMVESSHRFSPERVVDDYMDVYSRLVPPRFRP